MLFVFFGPVASILQFPSFLSAPFAFAPVFPPVQEGKYAPDRTASVGLSPVRTPSVAARFGQIHFIHCFPQVKLQQVIFRLRHPSRTQPDLSSAGEEKIPAFTAEVKRLARFF